MKTKIFTWMVLFFMGTATVLAASKTEKVEVKGNCGMCKTRIEKAAKSVDGVNNAAWNQETKLLQLTYDESKTDLKKIETAIAGVGHDTPLVKASDQVYNSLPACCKYDRSSSGKTTGSGQSH